jgi:hypothetical protein
MDITTFTNLFNTEVTLFHYIPNGWKGAGNVILGDACDVGWKVTLKADENISNVFTTAYGFSHEEPMIQDTIINNAWLLRQQDIFSWASLVVDNPNSIVDLVPEPFIPPV